MLKSCALLSSLLLLVGSACAQGTGLRVLDGSTHKPDGTLEDTILVNTSGFVTSTVFSNQNFYDNYAMGALDVGIYLTGTPWSFKTQLASDLPHVNRAVIEYDMRFSSKAEGSVQLGRFARYNSLYNDATDHPGTFGMDMLPMGGYLRREVLGNFTLMDGIQLQGQTLTPLGGLFRARVGYGSGVAGYTNTAQKLFYDYEDPTYKINWGDHDFDISFSYENGAWTAFTNYNQYKTDIELLDNPTPVAQFVYGDAKSSTTKLYAVGVRYEQRRYLIEGQLYNRESTTTNALGVEFAGNELKCGYIGAKVFLSPFSDWRVYGTHSICYNRIYHTEMRDNSVGISWDKGGRWTGSLGYHVGSGDGVKPYSTMTDWNVYVLSITRRF